MVLKIVKDQSQPSKTKYKPRDIVVDADGVVILIVMDASTEALKAVVLETGLFFHIDAVNEPARFIQQSR